MSSVLRVESVQRWMEMNATKAFFAEDSGK
jgi:hypothetical protein